MSRLRPATRIPAYHCVLGRRVGGINGAGRRKRIAEFPDVAGSGGGAYSEGTKPRVEARSEIRFVNDAKDPKNDPDHAGFNRDLMHRRVGEFGQERIAFRPHVKMAA